MCIRYLNAVNKTRIVAEKWVTNDEPKLLTKGILKQKGMIRWRFIVHFNIFGKCTMNTIKSDAIKLPWKEMKKTWRERVRERARERARARFQLKSKSIRNGFDGFYSLSLSFSAFSCFIDFVLYFILNCHMCHSKCVYLDTHVCGYTYWLQS